MKMKTYIIQLVDSRNSIIILKAKNKIDCIECLRLTGITSEISSIDVLSNLLGDDSFLKLLPWDAE
jgi:hypothetical protein